MNRGRFILVLTGFLLVMMTLGNITESCRKHRDVAPATSASQEDAAPVCTSTVSCPLPPPRNHEQAAP